MAWSIKRFAGLAALTAAELNQLRTNLNDHLRLHAHTGALGDGAAHTNWVTGVDFLPIVPSIDNSSGWQAADDALAEFGGYRETTDALTGHTASFTMALRPGTYRLDLLHLTGSDYGIATFSFNGVTLGAIDMYSAATTRNVASSLTGLAIAGTPFRTTQTFTLLINTKHASSTGYRARLQYLCLRRTGA